MQGPKPQETPQPRLHVAAPGEASQRSHRPEPPQEPLGKLTLILVASFPGSSGGDTGSWWDEQMEGEQRG